MHRAEALLIEKSPIIPLFCNVDVYATKELSGIKHDYFGTWNFTKMSQKNYKKYLPEEIVDATAGTGNADDTAADNADNANADNADNADNTAAE